MKSIVLSLFILLFGMVSCINVEQEKATVSEEDETVDPLMLNITSDPFTNPHPVLMAMHLGKKSLANDIPVSIFFNVGGVNMFAAGADTLVFHGENLHEVLKGIMSNGGTVLACPHCMEVAGLSESDLPDGVVYAKDDVMMEAIKKEPTVFSY
jgi:predicted peroxiredoxin